MGRGQGGNRLSLAVADVPSWSEQAERIRGGDRRSLARAATAVENRLPGCEELLRTLFPHTGRALVAGVTGAPGAGKSTFTGELLKLLRREGKRVAVVAVDPSSPYSGGAILGDRIRMQDHHADPGVFIRSMATRGVLGGLAAATLDLILLFDAGGYDVILVETVGVGQDEVEVARVAGVTAVMMVPGQGDDIQALKAGLLEIADVFVINKADRAGADQLERELNAIVALTPPQYGWAPPIVRTIASEGQGIAAALAALESSAASGHAHRRAGAHWEYRLREMFRTHALERLDPREVTAAAARVARREIDPYTTVHDWLERLSPQQIPD